jgi:hypothetical protein
METFSAHAMFFLYMWRHAGIPYERKRHEQIGEDADDDHEEGAERRRTAEKHVHENPTKDHLINLRIYGQSYLFVGVMETFSAHAMFFLYNDDHEEGAERRRTAEEHVHENGPDLGPTTCWE